MPAQFEDLPIEIKLQIFETVARLEWSPRVVEIYFKAGQIYSKTLPPPLLHVCQLSRYVVLKRYKPWLPQFKGELVHRDWEKRIENKDVERLSRLQSVCVSLEHDVLLINDKQWSPWDFGPIERGHLRRLAINLGGWFGWLSSSELYLQFTHLKHLDLFDRTKDQKTLSFKVDEIEKVLTKAQKKNKATQGSGRRYESPVVSREEIPTAVEWQGSVDEWIIYKYPKGYKSPVPNRRPGRPRRPDVLNELGTLISEPESSSRRTAPPRHGSKRGRTEYEADSVPRSSRKARRITQETPGKFITYVEQHQTPRPETPPQLSADQSFAKLRAYMEVFRSPSPEPEPLQKSPDSSSPAETSFQQPFHKYHFLRAFIEDSPEPQEITPPASCPAVVDPRSIFRNLFEAFIDLDITEDDGNNLKANYIDDYIPVLSCESNDVVFSSTENVDPASDKVFAESLIERDNRDDLVEPDNGFSINSFDSEKDTDNEFVDIDSLVLDAPTQLAPEPECPAPEAPAPEEEFIPKQFMAERKTTEGLQFLVQWQDYREEKDWTWETEAAMIKTAPDMVMVWLAKNEAKEETLITVDYVVERILGRRKFKGVPHYLVKWKGYEAVKDRTWEPCERLRIDVPLIVEAFEEKKKKK